jgi:hypothetical protein
MSRRQNANKKEPLSGGSFFIGSLRVLQALAVILPAERSLVQSSFRPEYYQPSCYRSKVTMHTPVQVAR